MCTCAVIVAMEMGGAGVGGCVGYLHSWMVEGWGCRWCAVQMQGWWGAWYGVHEG
jgi:hypothetical protein